MISGKAVDAVFGFQVFSLLLFLMGIAIILLVGGCVLIWFSMQDLENEGGTPNPRRAPKKIVTIKSYSICRHPMFPGYDLCAFSIILFWGSPGMLLFSFPIFLVLQIWFLKKEEKIFRRKFKQAHADYAMRTSFLLPVPFRKLFLKRQGRQD